MTLHLRTYNKYLGKLYAWWVYYLIKKCLSTHGLCVCKCLFVCNVILILDHKCTFRCLNEFSQQVIATIITTTIKMGWYHYNVLWDISEQSLQYQNGWYWCRPQIIVILNSKNRVFSCVNSCQPWMNIVYVWSK